MVAAACQGSGTPMALEWLGRRMRFGPGVSLLDCGAGMGGPAQIVAARFGVAPVLVDPMPGACRAVHRLFNHPTAVAAGSALPFASGSFAAAWSLGVLCAVESKRALLDELVRTVCPGGPVGLLVFVRLGDRARLEAPAGNTFPAGAGDG